MPKSDRFVNTIIEIMSRTDLTNGQVVTHTMREALRAFDAAEIDGTTLILTFLALAEWIKLNVRDLK